MNTNQYRKSPRAKFIDYDGGNYFVTICTKQMIHYFGEIVGGKMHLSPIGEIVAEELSNPGLHHNKIQIPLFVVMPNHIHAIVCISVNHINFNPIRQRNPNPALRANSEIERHTPLLSAYIASFKSAISREAHKIDPDFAWHSRYHDHLIRSPRDGNNIAHYIQTNVERWTSDCFYD